VLGALSLVDYQRMLPGGQSLTRLIALVLNYVGHELDWELNLVLRKEEAPDLALGKSGQLGWTTWLGHSAQAGDLDNLLLDPMKFQSPSAPADAEKIQPLRENPDHD
jgi:type VI secretion system protein ImpH